MALTKETNVDQITITENGVVYYREVTRVFEDGAEVSHSYHRTSLAPGQSLTGAPKKVSDVCKAVWTSEIVSAYKTSQLNLTSVS